jgi:hypothetical protein
MRLLLIDQATKERIKLAVKRAERRPIPLEVMRANAVEFPSTGKPLRLADRKPGYVERPRSQQVLIPVGFRAAFSIEEQPGGLVRHLSVSVDEGADQKMPNPIQFEMIAAEFGFTNFDHGWTEEFDPDRWAVNVIEMYKPKEAGHA